MMIMMLDFLLSDRYFWNNQIYILERMQAYVMIARRRKC